VRIGELFKNGTSATLSGATDPIVLSCQKNYHMLFTDGITNQPSLPATLVGNVDNVVPPLPVPLVVTPAIVAGSPWPDLYRENTAASLPDTLGDFAMHYWVTDLRPAMTNNVITGRDPATWQHVNFAALSLGTEGTLAGASSSVESQIATGAIKWPTPTPNQYKPNATGVDDLWHAAVNARGRFVNATTPRQLGIGIANILADITSPSGSAAPPTFANPNLSITNNYTYIAKFEQGWGGSVQKVQIDPLTAAPVSVVWDAKTQLIAQTTPTVPDPTPWFTKRRIVTVNEAGVAVPFLAGSLGPTQLATLGPDLNYQNRVIEYLRGKRAEEGEDDGQFRVRPSPLGDIVDSQGVLVAGTAPPPAGRDDYWEYLEANDPGYTAFKASQGSRPGRIYVGANDGMLHAFDEATGDEVWAFIPRDFYRSAPPVSNDKAGLIGLTYQPGGLPIYDHRFYVNATARVVDTNVGGTWKTLLVSGLGKGGKSYFALDATDPQTVVTEGAAAAKFLWEFRDPDLGYTYGKATIVKTRAFGWTVIIPSGYNNSSGEGKLFFVNPVDGSQLRAPLSTNVGTAGNPSGLAHIAGFTRDYRNQLVEQVYGGDLFGNLWRFDLSDVNPGNWKVEKLAVLTDGGTPQPITTPPRIDIDVANGVDRWVFVGTGKLTHACDLSDFYSDNVGPGGQCVGNPSPTQKQSMYAIRDGTYTTPNPIAAPITRADLDEVTGIAGLGSNVIASKGWYDDLNDQPGLPAGRIIRTPVAAVGLIAYIATSEPIDPCEVGLPATIYVRQFGNGESRLDTGGVMVESIYEPSGAAGMDVIAVNPPGCTTNCIPDIKLAVLSSSTSQLLTFKAKLPGIVGERRMSWGTLGQ
jgi:type IV pilus assembly protein PilY1